MSNEKMTDTEMNALNALQETGEELVERIKRGENVSMELQAWQKRVGRMTGSGPLQRFLAKILWGYTTTRAWIRFKLRIGSRYRKT